MYIRKKQVNAMIAYNHANSVFLLVHCIAKRPWCLDFIHKNKLNFPTSSINILVPGTKKYKQKRSQNILIV